MFELCCNFMELNRKRDVVGFFFSLHVFADGGDKEVVEQIYRIAIQVCLQGLESSVPKLSVSNQDAGLLHSEETDALKLPRTGATVYPEVRT